MDCTQAPVNLWIAIIAGTGEKKSPVLSRLMKPIHKKQNELVNEYKKLHHQWEQRQKQRQNQKDQKQSGNEDPEPKQVSLYTTDPTIEALIRMLNDNPHGVLLFQDEISGFLLGFDKYRGGRGGDREQYLSLWNGHPLKKDRVNESLYVPEPFLSLLGGLQPGKAVRLFGEDSFDDGLIVRFLFYRKDYIYNNVTLHEWREDYDKYWTDLIMHFYSLNRENKLELKLDFPAQQVFIEYENELTENAPYFPVRFRVFIPKATNYVLRISGILHAIEYAIQGQPIPLTISADTVTRAVKLVNYFLSQSRKIVEDYGPKKPTLSMDQKHILASMMSIYKTRNRYELPTQEIMTAFNSSVPKQIQMKSDISFGKLLKKILDDLKIPYQKERKKIDGKNRQCCIIDDKSLKVIRKQLEE